MSRPYQNRVLASGEIVAHPARGAFMGNRGILHDASRTLGRARWRHKAWVTCVLTWKDRHREVMTPGRYTELFFLDEAVALAAGHRPCGLCRHADFTAYRAAANVSGAVDKMDAELHKQRAIPRVFRQRREMLDADTLPDGTIILEDRPKLILGDAMYPVDAAGYGPPERRAQGSVTVQTPALSRAALANGYRPLLAL